MSVPESILFATSNPHKLEEVAAVLAPLGIAIAGLNTLASAIAEPVEDGKTFTVNAVIKARYYAQHTGRLCLADDSGLVVDALGGEPGVHSARYCGLPGPRAVVDPANNAKLLEKLHGVPDAQRAARFVCVMALADPRRLWAVTRGEVEGRIGHEPRGDNGFGYDPLFILPARGVTTAELTPHEKNAISHRGAASRMLARLIPRLSAGALPRNPRENQTHFDAF
jgi:XTP/dITP diphosphohydrolase